MLNFFIAGLFILLMIQIYRGMHGNTGGPGAKGKTGSGKDAGGFGSKMGGGGLGDIFGMGKSNV